MSEKESDLESEIQREAFLGTLPVATEKKIYGFLDAFLVLSGYCIATWSYTQGVYLTTLVGFQQLLIGTFFGAIFMLLIYQLPVILSTRYGIDSWIWLRATLGKNGVIALSVLLILINFPWYAVCAELFSSSMQNLLKLCGMNVLNGRVSHVFLAILCVLLGVSLAWRGIGVITRTTKILVPILLLLGIFVIFITFTRVPFHVIWDYLPHHQANEKPNIAYYIMSIEANFAFVITLFGGMSGIPRLAKTERAGYFAGVFGQGISGSLFVVVGAVMSIAMQHLTGKVTDDPTLMLATLGFPAMAIFSLFLVAFANIGTQALGLYLYGVVLKSSFGKKKYKNLIILLAIYVTLLVIWGGVTEYFGAFLTISACIYAPLAALLFADFFFVRKGKIDLRSAFFLKGHSHYQYTKGFNLLGIFCVFAGMLMSLAIYNPVTEEIHNLFLFHLTPTGFSFIGTLFLYCLLSKLPVVRRYLLKDRKDVTFHAVPFDREKTPPRQIFFILPIIWLVSFFMTRSGKLGKIQKRNMAGIQPPYFVIATHHSFMDFYITPLALFPHRANYISELEGFEAFGEWKYRQIGCLGTRKFVNDLSLIRNMKKVVERGDILVLYPEARYANVGTNSEIPISVAKMAKMLNVPLVALNMKGNYLQSPIWNLHKRKGVQLQAELKCLYNKEELAKSEITEIHQTIQEFLTYDEYAYQFEKKMKISYKKRAEGLETVLYQCLTCEVEFQMISSDEKLICKNCGEVFFMDDYGKLQTKNQEMTAIHIPDWYEHERKMVEKEIKEQRYFFKCLVKIEALPNGENFIPMGVGTLFHDKRGFVLQFHEENYEGKKEMLFQAHTTPSLHTEYDYRGKGQAIVLSTLDNSYFLFPVESEEGNFNVTKLLFATEFLYKIQKRL
ncbi:Purine-cytosine permease [Pilibacter termitis]|uniref:Purine-cytosine permease n=1 Tax=Pilibacter termitis TaxID=263852 RepID=A0A1T4QAK8_9ENTE|nr:cytosine permease [Pilibacter termitis]SKA00258.1 Purine-cytosine permease [Pilibacter termitis]